MTQIEDEVLLMTSPFRRPNATILRADLYMEFPHFQRPRKLLFKKYFVDIIPVVDRRGVEESSGCSAMSVLSKVRFPQDELEMRFDITPLYKACKDVGESKYFKFKLRFYVPTKSASDIDLAKEQPDIFIIFKETDDYDILELLSIAESDGFVQSHKLEKKKYPQLRHMTTRRKRSRPCSVRRWVLDFEKIGWNNWVFVPLQYEANLCYGRCPFPMPDYMNATNYAIVRTIASSVFRQPKAACCVAKELAPLTMIINDDDKATLKIQKDMITKSCACL